MSGAIAKFLARGAAGKLIAEIATLVLEHGGDLAMFRRLVAKAAQAGDLDSLYEAYFTPTQRRAKRYVETGDPR